ncbi:NADH dehydrogenase, alpha subcomplex, subunit 2, partial [Basidiobolus meristosporus CBS 931.73]
KSQLSQHIKELRIHFCQKSPASSGLREYVAKNYASLKESNPKVPILIREAAGVDARIFARYGFGQEKKVVLNNLKPQEIEKALETLVQSA